MTTAQGFRQFSTNEHFSFPHSKIITSLFFSFFYISVKLRFIFLAPMNKFRIGLISRRLHSLKKRRDFTFSCQADIVPFQKVWNMNFYMIGKHFII